MKDVLLITGANGHLAKVVSQSLNANYKIRHLTTKKTLCYQDSYFYWDINGQYLDPKALEDCKHIVHLAGFPILKRWNKKNKQIIYDSRIKSANLIFDTCKMMNVKLKTFISASAIGIYDQSVKRKNIDEESLKGDTWAARMVFDWENAANQFKEIGSRVVQMRISLIFSERAGFLKYNLLSMRLGIGVIVGDINRKINWMHVDDIADFVNESIENNNYSGPYNLACEDAVSQENFIKAMRKKLFPCSTTIKIPMFLIRFLLGERSEIIATNLSLETKRLQENGFKCKFNTLDEILQTIK